MAQPTRIISCACSAQYERVEVRLPIKDVGVFECGYCGAEIEHWHGRVVPAFHLHAPPKPGRKPAAA